MQVDQRTLVCAPEGFSVGLEALTAQLPRLVYIGDVSVEPTVYGSALLYRLLSGYPKEKLLILEGSPWRSSPDRRLPAIAYESLQVGNSRLIHSRLARFYGSWLLRTAEARRRLVDRLTAAFKPEAVLT